MHDHLKLISPHSLPLSFVENETVRRFSKQEFTFSNKYVKHVMSQLVELVETVISKEMALTKDSSLHDGWTNSGTHYVAVFASYVRKMVERKNNQSVLIKCHVVALLLMSSRHNKSSESD